MVSDFRPRESYQFFLQESVELLQTLEDGLLELREDFSTQKVHNLMRTAHSIKGGAACVGLNHIKQIAHNLENAFKNLYQEDTPIDLELEELLLQAYDRLKSPLLDEIHYGGSNPDEALTNAQEIWQQISEKLNIEDSENPDQDNAQFSGEINRSLERLESIVHNSEPSEMLLALKAQLHILSGLAEIAHLENFLPIIHQGLKNLTDAPESVVEIAPQVLEALNQAYGVIKNHNLSKNTEIGSVPPVKSGQLVLNTSAEASIEVISQEIKTTVFESKLLEPQILESQLSDTKVDELETQTSQPDETSGDKQHKLTSSALGIRMDASRLKLLHNLVGELVTEDNRFLLQNQQNHETLTSLTQWFNRFKQLNQNLKLWIDKLPSDRGQKNPTQQHLKSSLQTIMEELAQLGEGLQDLTFLDRGFEKILKTRQKHIKKLQNNLLEASMLPISELLAQFPRTVRDIATKEGKQVKLKLVGEKTLVDKAILEKLYDPLVHIIRNAIAHGLELPDIREHKNKPSMGILTITAYHQGNHTYIEIKDDGKGIDWETIRQSIIKKQLLPSLEASQLSHSQLAEFLFDPDFSTADKVSTLAGRGMGLSAVRNQIRNLKGTVAVSSQINQGTSFIIRLPLTLTIVKLLVFSIAGNLLAIPVDCLLSIVLADKQDIYQEATKKYYQWQGKSIPICPEALLSSYRYPRTVDPSKPLSGRDWQSSHKIPLLLLSNGTQTMALQIEQILMEQDLVIKPFDKAIAPPTSLIGCTVLGDGRLIPVLNSVTLVDKWLKADATNLTLPPAISFPTLPTVLIADDSLTIRQTLSTTLRKSGYRVIQARDGMEAIEQLKQQSSIQGIISDIEMPRMNGLEVLSRTRQLRGESFPVIMLTSRSSDKYRQLAQNLGATHYLTKPFVDKEVLATLESCLYDRDSS